MTAPLTRVALIDYGMGNLASVARALEESSASVFVADRPSMIRKAHRIVLPGVGAFAAASKRLHSAGWTEAIREALDNSSTALLGICLGMQMLGGSGEEGGVEPGLNLIPGAVTRMQPSEGERLPHVGWNSITIKKVHPLIASLENATDFYFVHSYHFRPVDDESVLATVAFAGGVAAIVGQGNVFGMQFHPEKSSRVGLNLLRNFVSPLLLHA